MDMVVLITMEVNPVHHPLIHKDIVGRIVLKIFYLIDIILTLLIRVCMELRQIEYTTTYQML